MFGRRRNLSNIGEPKNAVLENSAGAFYGAVTGTAQCSRLR